MALVVKNTTIPENQVKNIVIKALKARIEKLNQKIDELQKNMDYFNRKYGMESEEFYKKFKSGELGGDMDFMEWKASWEIFNELKNEKRALIEAIG